MKRYIEHQYIKEGSIEYREYQVNLAKAALDSNTLIILPTGLGKTTIALLIIADMLKSNKRILFMAPTRVLVHQHYSFLKEHLKIIDIGIITGEQQAYNRKYEWTNNTIICATPQVVKNDLENCIIKPEDFSLAIFDEAHRAIGNHAYSVIASLLKDHARIVGLTATIPSERAKAKEIIDNLFIEKIEQRDEDSQDVKQYIQKTEIETIEVELPLIIKKTREYIKNAIDNRIAALKRSGVVNGGSITELIRIKEYDAIKKNRNLANLLYSTIRLYHALKILDTQSINAFVKFCERLKERKGIGVYSLLADPNFKNAYEIARGAMISDIEHPKISKLYQILSKEEGKVLIFTSYRDNVKVLYDRLKMQGYRVGYLIGKAGEEGLSEDEQVDMVQRFRDGIINILIATNVGEEGLDISECNLVIFYDNVPSVIRFIQRKGRTGRKRAGRVILLITKDTLDEAYSHISRRKVKTAKNIVKRIKPKKKGILDYL
ncbi:MAG: hypothetical protein KatS3mg003_1971 [Candidatus Nitrosocaldaceae archaeon]|nr:MAG: hypothetical protein KatS3mg003_1971 [Candidatus Nitrosocaldaceae archaeon]